MGALLQFRILGPLEVHRDRMRVSIGGPRQRALLALLLCNANHVVSRDRLVDELLSDRNLVSAERMLQVQISRLRKALVDGDEHEQRLIARPPGYLLLVNDGELDLHTFERLVREGREAAEMHNPGRGAELLREADGLWRGRPLADLEFEPFARVEVQRLDELRLVAIEERIDADLALGHHAALCPELEALVAEHPLRERLHAQVMLALYRSDRQAEALDAYQRTRTRLSEELGLEPGGRLRTLQAQILNQDPSLIPTRVAPPGQADTGGERVDPGTMSRSFHSKTLEEPVLEQPPMLEPIEAVSRGLRRDRSRGGAAPPLPSTRTIGRDQDIESLKPMLVGDTPRLLTLVGPGGVGKTRLALTLAHGVEAEFPDGICWVELSGVTHSDQVATAIARALGLTPETGETWEDALPRYLAGRRLLLVLDNFEHVLGASSLVASLLSAVPGPVVLATSREPLNIAAEQRYPVDVLELPARPERATAGEVESIPATAMFLDGARRRDPRFTVTASTAPKIARLCARLDGLPLALELAAARIGVLGLDALAARLEESVTDLGHGFRDAPARQHTLTATIDWSYRSLNEQERSAFVRFAVFAGGATLGSVQAVTGATLDTLEALIAKSLIERRLRGDGSGRMAMLETLREYALDRLGGEREHDVVRARHLAHYVQLVQQAAPRLATHAEHGALAALDAESDNCAAALTWALAAAPVDALRLAGQLAPYWELRGDPNGLTWLDATVKAAEHAPGKYRARAQVSRAIELSQLQKHAEAVQAAEEAFALYRQAGDDAGMSAALRVLGCECAIIGEDERALATLELACRHAQEAGDDALLGAALGNLAPRLPVPERVEMLERADRLLTKVGDHRGVAAAYNNTSWRALIEGRPDEALSLAERGLRRVDEDDSPCPVLYLYGNLGMARLFRGELEQAREAFERRLKLCRDHAFPYPAAGGLAGLAAVAAAERQPERAARLYGLAGAMGYPPGGGLAIADRLEHEYIQPSRANYDPVAWQQAEHDSHRLSYDEAIAYALDTSVAVRTP